MVVVFVVQGSGVCGQFCLVVVDHKLADRPSQKGDKFEKNVWKNKFAGNLKK